MLSNRRSTGGAQSVAVVDFGGLKIHEQPFDCGKWKMESALISGCDRTQGKAEPGRESAVDWSTPVSLRGLQCR